MKEFFVLPKDTKIESVVEKTMSKEYVSLDNGYTISVSRERISNCGRSIFREIADQQIVLEIIDKNGKVTKRLPIPATKRAEIGALISQ